MLALEIAGPVFGTTGYDRHTREFTRALQGMGVPLQLTPAIGWSPAQAAFRQDAQLAALQQPRATNLTLHFMMPTLCKPRPGRPNVNYTMFEGDRIPPSWAARAADHALILVPNETCRTAWIGGGVAAEKLRIAPLAVDGEFFAQRAEPLPLLVTLSHRPVPRPLSTYSRRFLNISELRPRKNLLGLIRVWIRATEAGDDAVLVLKSTSFVSDDRPAFERDLRVMQQQLGRKLEQAAPVVTFTKALDDSGIRALYSASTHYISMSFGEGWDLAMMEAACVGLQLIAPRHSGYLSYLGDGDALWIPARAEPASFDGECGRVDAPLFAGIQWWRPDEEAAVEMLRMAIRGKTTAESPQKRIIRDFTWSNAARKLMEAIEPLAP